MGAIIRFNKDNLVLVLEVQRAEVIFGDAEMKYGFAFFKDGAVVLSYDFCATETILSVGRVSTRYKDGRVVNFDVDGFLDGSGEEGEF